MSRPLVNASEYSSQLVSSFPPSAFCRELLSFTFCTEPLSPTFCAEAFPSSFCKEPFSSAASPMIFFIFSSVNSSSRPHQKEQIPLDTGRLGSSPLTVSASLVATVYPLFSPPRSVISFPVDQIITEG